MQTNQQKKEMQMIPTIQKNSEKGANPELLSISAQDCSDLSIGDKVMYKPIKRASAVIQATIRVSPWTSNGKAFVRIEETQFPVPVSHIISINHCK